MTIRILLICCNVYTIVLSITHTAVILQFLEYGIYIYERHYRAIQFMNSLIQRSIIVRRYDEELSGVIALPSHQYNYNYSPETLPTLTPKSPQLCLGDPQVCQTLPGLSQNLNTFDH